MIPARVVNVTWLISIVKDPIAGSFEAFQAKKFRKFSLPGCGIQPSHRRFLTGVDTICTVSGGISNPCPGGLVTFGESVNLEVEPFRQQEGCLLEKGTHRVIFLKGCLLFMFYNY